MVFKLQTQVFSHRTARTQTDLHALDRVAEPVRPRNPHPRRSTSENYLRFGRQTLYETRAAAESHLLGEKMSKEV